MSTRRPAKINKVTLRFTDNELLTIHTRAAQAGITVAGYIQLLALDRSLETITIPTPDPSKALLLKELRIQGNNLNQIARALNRASLARQSVGNYRQQLIDIHQELKKLCHDC